MPGVGAVGGAGNGNGIDRNIAGRAGGAPQSIIGAERFATRTVQGVEKNIENKDLAELDSDKNGRVSHTEVADYNTRNQGNAQVKTYVKGANLLSPQQDAPGTPFEINYMA